MALFDSGSPVANVALSDTFNTWRVRTNQINTQAAGLASNNTFTGTLNTFNNAVAVNGPVTAPVVTANTIAGINGTFTGPVTAPVVTANSLAGALATAAQPNITSVGTLTSLATTGLLTAPTVQANTLTGTLSTAAQPNITSVGTLTTLSVTGTAGFNGHITAPSITANTFNGDGSGLTGLSAGLDWSATTSTSPHYMLIASNTSGSGIDQFNVVSGITIHPGSGRITANTFVGDGSGLTGLNAGATVTDKSDNVNYNIVFTNETSGTQALAGIDNAAFIFNPSTGTCSATIFNATSDERAKDNIETITDSLDKVLQLNGVDFTWKINGVKSSGLIAQQVEQVLPHVVTEGIQGMKGVNYGALIGVLVEAIKELNNKIENQ
jgi:hypothetical protein